MFDCPIQNKVSFGFRRIINEPIKEMRSMIQNINDSFCKLSIQLDKYKEELRKEKEENVKLILLTEETRRRSTDYVRNVEQLKLGCQVKFGYKISSNVEKFKNNNINNLTDYESASRFLRNRNLRLKQEKEGKNFQLYIDNTLSARENEKDRYKEKSTLYTTVKSKIPLRAKVH